MNPGYRKDMPMSDYLKDPCPEPSLSTSVVDALVMRTPMHAHNEHPRFGNQQGEVTARGEIGSAVHSLVLGGAPVRYLSEVTRRSGKDAGEKFIPKDWATKDAQEWRDEARASGILPMLEVQRADIEGAAASAARLLASLGSGRCEETMLWQMDGVWCRGRADWLSDDGLYDVDLKTVDSAEPYGWIKRTVYGGALDVQAGLRSRGHAVLAKPRTMIWLLVEITAPYAAVFTAPGPQMLDLAERKIKHAAKLWRECLDKNHWPGYPTAIHYADGSDWAEMDFQLRTGMVL